jgi:hypothetical protein
MGVLEDIAAYVADNTLTEDTRRILIAKRKAQEIVNRLPTGTIAVTHNGWQLSATTVNLTLDGHLQLFGFKAVKGGVQAPMDPHRIIVNPPMLIPDPQGTITLPGRGTFRLDPVANILDLLVAQAVAGGP